MSFRETFDLEPIHFSFNFVVDIFSFISLDWDQLAYPTGCLIGGYLTRILTVCFVPSAVIFAFPIMFIIVVVIGSIFCSADKPGGPELDGRTRRPSFSALMMDTMGAQHAYAAAGPNRPSESGGGSGGAGERRRSSSLSRRGTVTLKHLSKQSQRLLAMFPVVRSAHGFELAVSAPSASSPPIQPTKSFSCLVRVEPRATR
eukprot:7109761-Prymnesium_polylepis.1